MLLSCIIKPFYRSKLKNQGRRNWAQDLMGLRYLAVSKRNSSFRQHQRKFKICIFELKNEKGGIKRVTSICFIFRDQQQSAVDLLVGLKVLVKLTKTKCCMMQFIFVLVIAYPLLGCQITYRRIHDIYQLQCAK